MAVLLLILKIIGIILLILLGLILLILAVVLFVPVRYQVSGSIGEKTTVRIAVTWLLHAVSWRAAYEDQTTAVFWRGSDCRDTVYPQ